jgi:hypothetical protein
MALPDTAREAFVLGLMATALFAVSALAGLASWALYRIEREEAGQGADTGHYSFER